MSDRIIRETSSKSPTRWATSFRSWSEEFVWTSAALHASNQGISITYTRLKKDHVELIGFKRDFFPGAAHSKHRDNHLLGRAEQCFSNLQNYSPHFLLFWNQVLRNAGATVTPQQLLTLHIFNNALRKSGHPPQHFLLHTSHMHNTQNAKIPSAPPPILQSLLPFYYYF